MIKTVRIESLSELMQLFMEDEYRPELDRFRSQYIYRGMSDSRNSGE